MLRNAIALLITLVFGSLAHAQGLRGNQVEQNVYICEQEFRVCMKDGERADTAEQLAKLCKYERDGCVRSARHGDSIGGRRR